MKIIPAIILTLICYSSVSAQSGWFTQQTGTDITLRSIYMTNNNTGYCVGGDILIDDNNTLVDRGIILKTTNGGANWITQSPPNFDNILYGVTFTNNLTGYTVGRGSSGYAILKTTNGGINWVSQEPPPTTVIPPLYSLYFLNEETGYTTGAGGKVFRTTNGGTNWTVQSFPNTSTLYSVTFTSVNTGYIGSNNVIYRTTTGGASWDTSAVSFGAAFLSIFFSDNNTGYTAGGNKILKTTNGGTNWASTEIQGNVFTSIYFPSVITGYCAGELNSIYRTTNAGGNWVRQTPPGGTPLNTIFFTNDTTGYAAGNVGFMLRTTTGGTVGVITISSEIPESFRLHQNYPNPFNPETVIRFDVREPSLVKLSVYDLTGKNTATLINKLLSPGKYEYTFSGANFPSGVYYYRLEAEGFTEIKKMVLVK